MEGFQLLNLVIHLKKSVFALNGGNPVCLSTIQRAARQEPAMALEDLQYIESQAQDELTIEHLAQVEITVAAQSFLQRTRLAQQCIAGEKLPWLTASHVTVWSEWHLLNHGAVE